jgi:hypothetical protein
VDWQPEDRDAWVGDAEKWIGQIKGVLQCKIDLTRDGEISGVHVVARQDREPRMIVRDVEGLLKARLGITVFYKKIGVVQVVEAETPPQAAGAGPDPGPPSPEAPRPEPAAPGAPERDGPVPGGDALGRHGMLGQAGDDAPRDAVLLAEELGPRLQCNGVGVMSAGTMLRAEVDLQAAGLEASGTAEGPNRNGGDLHLVAQATLAAVESLVDEPLGLELSELRRERLGGDEVVLVAVELVQGRRTEQLYGACQPGPNTYQAVVYAILDALNRRLELMLFKAADEV